MKKYTFILSVILISLLAVGAVSASDSDNFTNDVISSVKGANITTIKKEEIGIALLQKSMLCK